MYNKITHLLKFVIDKLKSILLYLKSKEFQSQEINSYNSLSPIGDADKDGKYTEALRWALQTRHENDIRNIAITGPYGSGKSSVIKTFQNNYETKDLQFLNISLATFKEEILDNEDDTNEQDGKKTKNSASDSAAKRKNDKNKANSNDLIRLIELSILQQIFYHANDSEIPESRFKKIKRIDSWTIRMRSLATILFILSSIFLCRNNLPETVATILDRAGAAYFYILCLVYLLALTYLISFYIDRAQKRSFKIRLPIILIGINISLLLYIAYVEFRSWIGTPLFLEESGLILNIFDSLTIVYVIVFGIFALYTLLQSISRISINKLKFQDAEIEIDSKINKSILNHHLDEIIYFFEVTNYNVVIIEDLDRFQQTEIFTKLREINLLLNNSKKTKHKEIVFIYAVRDEMFTDKERSKFFDFIIPIIPVINSTNSSQQLLKKNTKYDYGWTEDLIDSLSIYIDDMRLLHNICNEFEIYKNKLTEKLDRNKLLAILVYKNLFPNDFSKLNNNEGNLWNKINSKQDFISKEVNRINDDLESYTSKLEHLEQLKILEVGELRQLYLLRYIDKFDNFKSFRINNSIKSLNEMCLDENFNYLTANNLNYDSFINQHGFNNRYTLHLNQSINHKFEDIETEVNPNKTYKERLEEINDWHLGKANTLRKKIQELEQNKVKIRRSKIKDILSTNNIPVYTSKDIKQSKLINVLLRNGYIDEDYHDFMSIFYEGNLTKSDNDFLISVKSQESLEFSYQLSKIDALVKKIHSLDFEQAYILNNDLITFLLNNPTIHKTQLENVFKKLKDGSEISIRFIINYIDDGEELEKFINKICQAWGGFWKHIENASNIPNDKKEAYFRHILSYADLADMQILSKNSQMELRIEKDKHFLSIIPNTEKLKEILETLDVDFHDLDFDNSPDELLTYVYENWNYKITPSNISGFIKKYGKFDQQIFDTSNYEAIMTSQCSELIDYINNNLDEYVENVYLKIESNIVEKEKYLIELLNNEQLSINSKNRIVSRMTTVIQVLHTVKDTALYSTLLTENKIASKWNNILHAYTNLKIDGTESEEENNLPKEIVDFISIIENSEKLSKTKTPTEGDLSSNYKELWKTIIYTQEVEDEYYSLVTKSCPWWYKDLYYENLSESKTKILIDNSCVQPVEESYKAIKQAHEGLNIYLFERRKNDFLKLLEKLQFDSLDLESILKSTLLTSNEKFKVLEVCETDVINISSNLRLITSLLIPDETLEIKDDVLDSIMLDSDINPEERLKLFIKNQNRYNNEFIEKFVDRLDAKRAKINDKTIIAKIPKTETNKAFLGVLERKGYISSFSEAKLSNDYRINHKRK